MQKSNEKSQKRQLLKLILFLLLLVGCEFESVFWIKVSQSLSRS